MYDGYTYCKINHLDTAIITLKGSTSSHKEMFICILLIIYNFCICLAVIGQMQTTIYGSFTLVCTFMGNIPPECANIMTITCRIKRE